MKRSEMVQIIMDESDHGFDAKECAEFLLTAIEKAGMLPPCIITTKDEWDTKEGHYTFEELGHNKWEEE